MRGAIIQLLCEVQWGPERSRKLNLNPGSQCRNPRWVGLEEIDSRPRKLYAACIRPSC
jgi:hypothetical protein